VTLPEGAGEGERPGEREPARQRPVLLAALAAAVLLLAGGVAIGVGVARSGSTATAGGTVPIVTSVGQIAGMRTYTYAAGQSHVVGTVDYPESPPVGGRHDPEWADCSGTVYPAPIRNENAVHSLEHGAVWITYDPRRVSAAQIATLGHLVRGVYGRMLSPYPGLAAPISLQSWNHQLFLRSAGDVRAAQFADFLTRNPDVTPEIGATCENAAFVTAPIHPGDGSRAASGLGSSQNAQPAMRRSVG
jgi:hypothetical protein